MRRERTLPGGGGNSPAATGSCASFKMNAARQLAGESQLAVEAVRDSGGGMGVDVVC